MKNILLPIIFVLLVIACSCVDEKDIEVGNINNFNVVSVREGKLDCKAEMEISNKSIFPFKIETTQLYVYSGSQVLGNVKLKEPLKINGHSKQNYKLNFIVEINDAEASLMSFIGSFLGNKPVYKLKGEVNAGYFFINKQIAVDRTIEN